jgi:hypothetical protein
VMVAPDGTVSAPFTVASRPGYGLSAAFDGTNFLVAWQEQVPFIDIDHPSNIDLYAARVTPAGQSLDPGAIALAKSPSPETDVHVAFDGTHYLAAWFLATDPSSVGAGEIHAARIATDGTLIDAAPGGLVLSANANLKGHPRVARFGADSLVVWELPQWRGATGIYAKRVAADGALRDGDAGSDGTWLSDAARAPRGFAPGLAMLPAVATAPDRALVVWLDEDVATLRASLLLAAP